MCIYKKKLKSKKPLQFASLKGNGMFLQHVDNCFWVLSTQWHSSVLWTEDGHSLSPTYCRAGGDEEFQLILRTLFQVILRTQDHVQERWGLKEDSQRKPRTAAATQGILTSLGWGRSPRSLQLSLGEGGQALSWSPRRKRFSDRALSGRPGMV